MLPGWNDTEAKRKYRIPSAIYHHDLAKSVAVTDGWGNTAYPLFTNSLGFKDKMVRAVPLKGERKRLLLIGDSFTEGVGYAWEQTFAGRVAEALDRQGIEVLNAAVSSYSPVLYYKKVKYLLEEVGLRFDELAVFVDIGDVANEGYWYHLDDHDTVIGDINGGILIEEKNKGALRRFFDNNSILVKAAALIRQTKIERQRQAELAKETSGKLPSGEAAELLKIAKMTRVEESLWDFDDAAYQKYGIRGEQRSRENMDRLLAVLRKFNIPLRVIVYPWPDQVMNGNLNSRQVQLYRAWCEVNNVPFLSLYEPFLKAGAPREVLDKYYIPFDIHWNDLGHGVVAEGFLDWYKRGGIGYK